MSNKEETYLKKKENERQRLYPDINRALNNLARSPYLDSRAFSPDIRQKALNILVDNNDIGRKLTEDSQ